MHDGKVILKGKKYEAHYLLIGSSMQGRVFDVDRSLVQSGALDIGRSDMRCETREDDKRCHRVKFLLPQEAFLSRSQVRQSIIHYGDGIELPGSTPMFSHP